jgi:hypothetical protein
MSTPFLSLGKRIPYRASARWRGPSNGWRLARFSQAASQAPWLARETAGDEEATMLWTIFVVLLVLWLLGFFAFHVTSGLIHVILVVAVIVLILGLVRR